MSPVAINGVDKQGVFVNGVQVKQALDAANETVNKGVYALTTLSAVDGDLAVGNIKNGVQIFGFTGTFVGGAITHDAINIAASAWSATDTYPWRYNFVAGIPAGGDSTALTTMINCLQDTVVEAAYCVLGSGNVNGVLKSQMYIDGVAQGETGFWTQNTTINTVFYDTGHQAVSSGNRTVYLNLHNYHSSPVNGYFAGGIYAAACKLV